MRLRALHRALRKDHSLNKAARVRARGAISKGGRREVCRKALVHTASARRAKHGFRHLRQQWPVIIDHQMDLRALRIVEAVTEPSLRERPDRKVAGEAA